MTPDPSLENRPSPPLSRSRRRHLETQLAELDGRYQTAKKHIAALNTDVGRETDTLGRQTLVERRDEIARERDAIVAEMTRIEGELGEAAPVPDAAEVGTHTGVSPRPYGAEEQRAALLALRDELLRKRDTLALQKARTERPPYELLSALRETEIELQRVEGQLALLDG